MWLQGWAMASMPRSGRHAEILHYVQNDKHRGDVILSETKDLNVTP